MKTQSLGIMFFFLLVPGPGGLDDTLLPDDWWDYQQDVGGHFVPSPRFWGLVNAAWKLCAVGRKQSPIRIDPSAVVYDPFLQPLDVRAGGPTIAGCLYNTGHYVSLRLDAGNWVNVSGGPLSYTYSLDEIRLHFGTEDGVGSEHLRDSTAYSGEVQLIHYNVNLYSNASEASQFVNGLMIISIFLKIDDVPNPFLNQILNRETITRISYKGDRLPVRDLVWSEMLPPAVGFVTYSGSQTTPPCRETVVWVLLQGDVSVTSVQMHSLRILSRGTRSAVFQSMGGNHRPVQLLNNRSLRTNVDARRQRRKCPRDARGGATIDAASELSEAPPGRWKTEATLARPSRSKPPPA